MLNDIPKHVWHGLAPSHTVRHLHYYLESKCHLETIGLEVAVLLHAPPPANYLIYLFFIIFFDLP